MRRTGGLALLAVLAVGAAAGGGTASEPATTAPERIAFVSLRGGNVDVYVAAADGTDVRRLTEDPGRDEAPAWSPGGGVAVYRLSLVNAGTLPAAAVTVTLRSPAGAVAVAAAPSTGTCTLRPLACAVGELAPAAGVTLDVGVRLGRAGVARPVFSVRSAGADPDRTNDALRFETIVCTRIGTAGTDRLLGTPRRDVLCGLGGADVLDGRGGPDRLYGGDGDDRLVGGSGRDVVAADPGCDVVRIRDGERDAASADYERPPGLVYDVGVDRVGIAGNCRPATRTR